MIDRIIQLVSNELGYVNALELNKINLDNYYEDIIKIINPFIYDRLIKYMEFKYDTDRYNEKRKRLIEKILLNQKDQKILDSLVDINCQNYNNSSLLSYNEKEYLKRKSDSFDEAIERVSNRWSYEYIISYFFQDNYYNFMVNFHQMTNYLVSSKKNIVPIEHIKIYEKFLKIDKMTLPERISLFKEYYKNNDLMEMFYDDMRKTKDDCYQELVNSSLKINSNSPIYNQELSSKYHIPVYYLNGEEFFAFIRCFEIKRDDLSDNSEYLFSKDNRFGYSFSYISNHHIGTIDYYQKNVILLYDNIIPENIAYVHHADMHSGLVNNPITWYISEKENELLTPKNLMYETKNYNEIFIRGNDGFKPKALVCYNEISTADVNFANKYQLSIVLINTTKYRNKMTYEDSYEDYTYIL